MIGEAVPNDNHSQSIESGLAQAIWQRYTVTPSAVQRMAILQPIQSIAAWSMARAPLLNDVQKRWRPTGSDTGRGTPLELPFANFENPVSKIRENALVVQRKPFGPPEDLSQDPLFEVPPLERRMIVPAAMHAGEPVESSGGIVPTGNHPIENPLVQQSSAAMTPTVQRRIFSGQPDQPQGSVGQVDLPHAREAAPTAIESVQRKSWFPETSATHVDDLGIYLLRRHLEMPMTQVVQRKRAAALQDGPPAPAADAALPHGKTSALAGIQSNGQSDILHSSAQVSPLPIVHVLQRQPDSSPPSGITMRSGFIAGPNLVTNKADISIQRSRMSPSHSQVMPSQLPLAQSVQINVAASLPHSFIQMPQNSINPVNIHQSLSTHLIQRQSQPGERTATAASGDVPAMTPPVVPGNNPVRGVDIDKVADQVMRIILRQMTVERERRGIGR